MEVIRRVALAPNRTSIAAQRHWYYNNAIADTTFSVTV
jgi:hypothetical protein